MIALTGIDALFAPLRTLSWRVAVLIFVPSVLVELLHTVAWRVAFVRPPVSLGRLFSVRLAGEALNLGTASVGGEPVKVYLLRPWVPLADAAATQVVDKTATTVGQILFLAVGLAVVAPRVALPAEFVHAMVVLLAAQIVLVGAFVLVQCVGIGDRALVLLRRFGVAGGAHASGVLRFDRALAASYRERWDRVVACTLLHLAAWLVGALELYLMLRWLGVETPFVTALAIDAFGTGIKFLAFAIPGALGVLEGGNMVVFAVFGLGGSLGLTFSLVRRLRMVAWGLIGVVVLALMRGTTARDE
jgi:uncharacterized protein (TIRG00374 family)